MEYNNRKLEITEAYGEQDDIEFRLAWADSGKEIDNDEIYDYVYTYHFDELYDAWFENKIDQADFIYDCMKDGTYE